MANIEKYCDVIPIKVRVNLTSRNHESLHDFLSLLDDRGLLGKLDVNLAMVSCFEGFGYVDSKEFVTNQEISHSLYEDTLIGLITDPEMREKLHAYKYRSVLIPANFMQCTAKRPDSFLVGPRGELYKCALAFGDAGEIVGNILATDFPDKALESRYLGFDVSQDPICTDCLAYPACRGGCLISRFKSRSLSSRCFISIPRWEKVLKLHLEHLTGVSHPDLTRVSLYPSERRLGPVIVSAAVEGVSD
ncbi:SPASM domain-containing protein [bacterium]|nr:SPASM domain-containing protein [bacterium]